MSHQNNQNQNDRQLPFDNKFHSQHELTMKVGCGISIISLILFSLFLWKLVDFN